MPLGEIGIESSTLLSDLHSSIVSKKFPLTRLISGSSIFGAAAAAVKYVRLRDSAIGFVARVSIKKMNLCAFFVHSLFFRRPGGSEYFENVRYGLAWKVKAGSI